MDCITEIRYYHFMAGVLVQQHTILSAAVRHLPNQCAARQEVSGVEERKASEIMRCRKNRRSS